MQSVKITGIEGRKVYPSKKELKETFPLPFPPTSLKCGVGRRRSWIIATFPASQSPDFMKFFQEKPFELEVLSEAISVGEPPLEIPMMWMNERGQWEKDGKDPILPSGLLYLPSFINEAEEQQICQEMTQIAWQDIALKRKVIHYGYVFNYLTRKVDPPTLPIPPYLQALSTKIEERCGLVETINQITINRYLPGEGIQYHVDTHSVFGEYIISLSLATDVPMHFLRKDVSPPLHTSLYLQRRSLVVLTGESRYQWRHSIRSRKKDMVQGREVERGIRYSITFRSIASEPGCDCGGIECDMVSPIPQSWKVRE